MCDNTTKYGFLEQNRTLSYWQRLNDLAVSHMRSFLKKSGFALDKSTEGWD